MLRRCRWVAHKLRQHTSELMEGRFAALKWSERLQEPCPLGLLPLTMVQMHSFHNAKDFVELARTLLDNVIQRKEVCPCEWQSARHTAVAHLGPCAQGRARSCASARHVPLWHCAVGIYICYCRASVALVVLQHSPGMILSAGCSLVHAPSTQVL